MTDDELKLLFRLSRLLGQGQETLGRDASLQMMQALLLVAQNEGLSLTDLCDLAGVAQSTMSRHLLDLGERNRLREPGLGLLVGKTDLQDSRRKRYTLTPKGRKVVRDFLKGMSELTP